MAEQLIEALTMKWDPEQFHETFQEKAAAMIEAKQAGETGETVEQAEPASEPTGVVDLKEALRASVQRAGSPSPPATRPPPPARRPRRGLRRRSGSAPKEDLSGLSKADLYQKAAADIPGRSHMARDELVKALSSSRT
ncbi:hypothetical protein PV721_21165 [Streptomyces sp. MB09-01]|uniref:hypothetical protein n=1 Tax=Streptomyces sp. MB09-01 TaxID=3028666 RepID=UPI0029AC5FB6|nr:hypothetical protein [Streptomyces sp. MB09-01]MDX3536838.1 hypothetical protein [Streptomyces sp. MB09-01]